MSKIKTELTNLGQELMQQNQQLRNILSYYKANPISSNASFPLQKQNNYILTSQFAHESTEDDQKILTPKYSSTTSSVPIIKNNSQVGLKKSSPCYKMQHREKLKKSSSCNKSEHKQTYSSKNKSIRNYCQSHNQIKPGKKDRTDHSNPRSHNKYIQTKRHESILSLTNNKENEEIKDNRWDTKRQNKQRNEIKIFRKIDKPNFTCTLNSTLKIKFNKNRPKLKL